MKSRTFVLAILLLTPSLLQAADPAVNVFMSPASGHAYYPPQPNGVVTVTATVVNGYADATTTKRFHFQMTNASTGERLNGSSTTTGTVATWKPQPAPKPGKYQIIVSVGIVRNADNKPLNSLQKIVSGYIVNQK